MRITRFVAIMLAYTHMNWHRMDQIKNEWIEVDLIL